jgi:hypothetical protein
MNCFRLQYTLPTVCTGENYGIDTLECSYETCTTGNTDDRQEYARESLNIVELILTVAVPFFLAVPRIIILATLTKSGYVTLHKQNPTPGIDSGALLGVVHGRWHDWGTSSYLYHWR